MVYVAALWLSGRGLLVVGPTPLLSSGVELVDDVVRVLLRSPRSVCWQLGVGVAEGFPVRAAWVGSLLGGFDVRAPGWSVCVCSRGLPRPSSPGAWFGGTFFEALDVEVVSVLWCPYDCPLCGIMVRSLFRRVACPAK